jgi:hypothetical protein
MRYKTTERDRTRLRLHIVYQSTLHGIITGLSGIRTMSSLEDGLDRLLVSFKDAKVSGGILMYEHSSVD